MKRYIHKITPLRHQFPVNFLLGNYVSCYNIFLWWLK